MRCVKRSVPVLFQQACGALTGDEVCEGGQASSRVPRSTHGNPLTALARLLGHAAPPRAIEAGRTRVLPGPPRPSSLSYCLRSAPRSVLSRFRCRPTQIAQYTCVYNAVDRTVACEPFVRTFVRMANERSMTEVTPTVNAGGPLPKGPLAVAHGHERPACVVAMLGGPERARSS